MSARPWRVEISDGANGDWQKSLVFSSPFGSHEAAAKEVRKLWAVALSPFRYRIVNRDTAEVIHV